MMSPEHLLLVTLPFRPLGPPDHLKVNLAQWGPTRPLGTPYLTYIINCHHQHHQHHHKLHTCMDAYIKFNMINIVSKIFIHKDVHKNHTYKSLNFEKKNENAKTNMNIASEQKTT